MNDPGEQQVNVNVNTGKSKGPNIVGLILVILLLSGLGGMYYYTMYISPPTPQKILAHWEDSIKKSYDVIIKKKEDTIKMSGKVVNLYKDSILFLNNKVAENNNSIQQVKIQTHEKIVRINSMSSDNLSMFFTNRFGGK